MTSAKSTEDALKASEERLRLATDAAELGIWMGNLSEDTVTWENDRPWTIFGIPRSEPPINLARFMREFVHPDDGPSFQAAAARTVATGERLHFVGRFRRLDGAQRWVEFTAKLLRGPDGGADWMLGTVADVTDRKRSEDQDRQAAVAAATNAKFRAFFEQGTNFAGVLSLDGTVIEANRLCLDACGFTRANVIGRPFWECGWWRPSPTLMELVRKASLDAAAGQQFRTDTHYFLADGSERFVELILAPVTDEQGRVLFVAATGSDTTERRRAEEELRDASRRKDDFLATLAHELRNPLAPIRTGLELLKIATIGAEAEKARATMARQVNHMVRLIDDLLDVSRITFGQVELRKERVELRAVIEDAVETSRSALDAARHAVSIELPKEAVWLDADLTRLVQVVSNVLTNAAKYTPAGGNIALSARREGTSVIVTVTDSGVGIPAEHVASVFDMFTQVNKNVGRSQGGLGIGLALSKGLVERHGGTLEAASVGLGKGSTFTIRLPTAEVERSDTGGAVPAVAEGAAPGRRRILVVDDNIDGAELLGAILDMMGHETKIAHDGESALPAAHDFVPEVVFLDIGLPGISGYEVAKRLRNDPSLARAVLVAVTGWGSADDKKRTRDAGFDFHVTKPVETQVLIDILAGITRGPMSPPPPSSDRRAQRPSS